MQEANEKLVALSVQKDGFLSQISHELRTPMTSIRSFSEILMQGEAMSEGERQRYSQIIHDEAIRLTRLLDDLLDLSVLENGQVTLNERSEMLDAILDRAVAATARPEREIEIVREPPMEAVPLFTDGDRLAQVFINLISNAGKYCDSEEPKLRIEVRLVNGRRVVDFVDNGSGVPADVQNVMFEKFARGTDHRAAGGAGLGLAICREVMKRLGGDVIYLPDQDGSAFRVILPDARRAAA